MTERNRKQTDSDAEKANRNINDAFYGKEAGTEEQNSRDETKQANQKINDEFYSENQEDDSIEDPDLYLNNNNPALVVKDEDNRGK